MQNVYTWARQNGITTAGFENYTKPQPADTAVEAPCHGHFADRAHTLKYARQKAQQGSGGLLCLQLKPDASEDLQKLVETKPEKVAGAGEGYDQGKGENKTFGMKHETDFISVAVSNNKDDWNFLRTRVQKVTLED